MEQKNLKTSVFSNETVFNETAEQAIDVDFTLPDYCPDINKILKCKAVSRISSKGINGRSITADGSVTITVIYCDGEQRLCSYEYQYPFSKTIETSKDFEGGNLICKTKCEYINCRAVTNRKIDIHGAVGIYVKVIKRNCTEVICDVDDKNIELRRGTAPATSPMGNAEKYLLIEEDIEIGQGQPPIRSLVRYDCCVAVKESKLLAGKAMVKGELIITMLYCPDEKGLQSVKTAIPFTQLLEVEGVGEECGCSANAEISYIDIKPRISATGEARSFEVNGKLLITCECFCDNNVDVVFDAYSRKYEANIEKNTVCFNKVCKNICESFTAKKTFEFSADSVSSVADMWCEIKGDGAKIADGKLTLFGTAVADIIAYDKNGELSLYEKPVDFEHNIDLGIQNENMRCEPKIEVLSATYTITGSLSMEIRIDLSVSCAVLECNNISLITDVDLDKKHQIEKKEKGALTIYFASNGENIWDIARKYRASIDEIKQINDVDSEILNSDKMILVPIP